MLPDIQIPAWFQQLGVMGWPLAIASVLAVAICAERSVFFLKVSLGREKRLAELRSLLTQHRDLSKPLRDEILATVLTDWKRSYVSGIQALRLIGSTAPLLGLLGTILGIIAAFQKIAAQTGPVAPHMIADGLWEAMLTTAAGLFIALPALVMTHVFQQMSEARIADYCHRMNALSASMEIEKERQQSSAPVTGATESRAA